MSVEIRGLQNILQNMAMIAPTEAAKMNNRMIVAGNVVHSVVQDHATLTDHSLEELAAMGHPYSTRYPNDSAPHPDGQVHIQSRKLYDNIEKVENLGAVMATVEIGVSEDNVPYIGDLITGTSKMRPRNFIGKAFDLVETEIPGILKG